MSDIIRLVQGDTKPDIVVALVDPSTYDPIDVSDPAASVTMTFRAAGTSTILQTIVASKLEGQLLSDGTVDDTIATPGAGGRVQFSWPAGALDIDPGRYEGEISITFADGTIQTIYDFLYFSVREDM